MRAMCATNRSRVRRPEASNRGMDMSRFISKNILLLTFSIVIFCGLYPLSLWVIGQTRLPFEANSIMLSGPENTVVGSPQIAKPSTKGEYFQPLPPAASYAASTSTSSAAASSNNLFHLPNSDFGVSETPLLQRPAQRVCSFYDC
jgi:K+-transporting ATPase, c chain